MSEWYRVDNDDIDVNWDDEDVDILVTYNDFGNVYVSLTFKQIEEIFQKTFQGPEKS